ncbi:C39 family peptidase [Candidatus Saccharibacteria bacterium]|nr:C39 family peptidase [Candidatus Saccharibacteria bacterium]
MSAGKTYTYIVKKGLRSTTGGVLVADQSGKVSTMGAVVVTASSPRGKNLTQAKQTISFTFDQPVDHESAQSRVSLSSGTIGGFSWQGNTLNVTATNVGYQRTVTASIAAGVVNASFGLPSSQVFSTSFTTETRTVRLTVPYYKQQHSATCTAAALRMVLGHRGVSTDEIGLVNAMGYAPRSKDTSTNPHTWDDPDQMFVGSIDGAINTGTGAGPDAIPVAKAARAYGRSAQNFTGVSASWIAGQIHGGNPVIMFGAYKATGMTSWRTPTGKTATMNLTGHVTVVTGVVGEPSSPVGFYVHDPLDGGKDEYWSAGAVAANIARDPYGQAVVVY